MNGCVSTDEHQILIVKSLLHLLLPHLLQETLGICGWLCLHLSRNCRLRSSRSTFRHYLLLPRCWYECWLLVIVLFEKVIRGVFVELVGYLFIAIVVVVEVEDEGEGKTVVDLVFREGLVIEVEALKHEVEQLGQTDEFYSPLSQDLLLAGTAVVQIVFV